MNLYSNNKGKLTLIKESRFDLEKDLQKLFEQNLQTILGLTFVKSECVIKDKRFDTLAFDAENKSFVIIGYKRDKNSSVIDQGVAYLHMVLDNKAECVLEINERLHTNFKRNNINWDQTRVIFVAPSFNDNQKIAARIKEFPIQLLEVRQFSNGCVSIDVVGEDVRPVSMASVMKRNPVYESVSREIKVYTEEEHLAKSSQKIVELYEDFKAAILNLDANIKVEPKQVYVAFKDVSNVCDIEIKKDKLRIFLNAKWGTLKDPKGLFRNISKVGHWGNGDYATEVTNDDNIGYIIDLLKQVIKKQ